MNYIIFLLTLFLSLNTLTMGANGVLGPYDLAAVAKKGAVNAADDVMCQIGCFTEGTPVATAKGEKPIESLRVGDRVLNTGTIAGEDTPTEVNAAEWCRLVLRMALPEQPGNAVEVETLRRKAWCQERGVVAGALMPLELEPLGLSGPARILRVESCPEIKEGEGRVVLSTFTHYNTDVYSLRLEGNEEVLHPTGRHPLFSVSRGDWVAVNELAEGDLLQTRSGPKKITSLGRKPGMHRVYNLEVEGEHCYFVGRAAVLGHNAGMACSKVVNSEMAHASKRAVERAGFNSMKEARDALQAFGKNLERNGIPAGARTDTARADRIIVPGFGNGGAVVYQVMKNGKLRLKTVLNWMP